MLFAEFFTWWYSRGFVELFNRLKQLLFSLWSKLSINILFKTLFDPWRRIVTESGGSIADKSRALIDNAVSRFIGFSIRIIVIITAVVLEILIIVGGAVLLVAWPLMPAMVPLAFFVGLAL